MSMKRREFIAASTFAGLSLAAPRAAQAASTGSQNKELIELRLCHFADAQHQKQYIDFLVNAAIPALNRQGVRPVGVFRPKPNEDTQLYVLIPHKSAESVVTLLPMLAQDAAFIETGTPIWQTPKSDPVYTRYESSLMLAFDSAPKVEVHSRAANRLMQLRIYESHNMERALKKIEMFNEGGEIAIFRRCGMTPVFFGQTLIGDRQPNLTYMLGFDNEEAQKTAWDRFGKDPDWNRIKNDEQYKDTVSNITNLILTPVQGSQI